VYCDPPHPKPVKPVKSSIVETGRFDPKSPRSLSQYTYKLWATFENAPYPAGGRAVSFT
jgi:hypothetical protein